MIHAFDQLSREWFFYRAGRITGSGVHKMLAKGDGKTRTTYALQLAYERLSGMPVDTVTTKAMWEGRESEPEALLCYEWESGQVVEAVGFVDHPSIDWAGCSPDGLVGADGLVQVKCPLWKTQEAILKTEKIPALYYRQMQWELACTGRDWNDFMSYHPQLPPFIQRVYYDEACILKLEASARKLNDDINNLLWLLLGEKND